jgi:hypothetical protein
MATLSSRRAGVLLACLALFLPSCGNRRKPVFTVTGQVLDAKQKPAVGAMVIFHPSPIDPKDTLKPLGFVGDEGKFALTTYDQGDGAPAGDYVITVIWPMPRKTPFDPEGGDQLQGRYANPERSTLKFKVEGKPGNEVPPIRLQ